MLNAIATSLVAWALREVAVPVAGSNNIGTEPIASSGHVGGLSLVPGSPVKVFGFIVVSVAVGLAFHVLLNRTRFGYDLRATGQSQAAAVASGVPVKRMVVYSMLLSGAVAGLIGMPELLGASHSYALNFPAGLGFTGIAIALLGRNHPVGIAFAALFWAYLDVSQTRLGLADVSQEIVSILQGTVLIAVVVAYELVRRYRLVLEQRQVGRQVGTAGPTGPSTPQVQGASA
jgi:simple sugar transport system permease protein